MKRFLVAFALLLGQLSFAGDFSLSVGINTTHVIDPIFSQSSLDKCLAKHGANANCVAMSPNENNRLIGLNYNNFEIFTMLNSYSERAYGASYRYSQKFWHVRAGVVSGYNLKGFTVTQGDGLIPMVVAGLTLPIHKNVSIESDFFYSAVVTTIQIKL